VSIDPKKTQAKPQSPIQGIMKQRSSRRKEAGLFLLVDVVDAESGEQN